MAAGRGSVCAAPIQWFRGDLRRGDGQVAGAGLMPGRGGRRRRLADLRNGVLNYLFAGLRTFMPWHYTTAAMPPLPGRHCARRLAGTPTTATFSKRWLPTRGNVDDHGRQTRVDILGNLPQLPASEWSGTTRDHHALLDPKSRLALRIHCASCEDPPHEPGELSALAPEARHSVKRSDSARSQRYAPRLATCMVEGHWGAGLA